MQSYLRISFRGAAESRINFFRPWNYTIAVPFARATASFDGTFFGSAGHRDFDFKFFLTFIRLVDAYEKNAFFN